MKNFILWSVFDDVQEIVHIGESRDILKFEKEMKIVYPNKFNDKSIYLYAIETKKYAKPLKMNWEE
jgi:hypothetical protein